MIQKVKTWGGRNKRLSRLLKLRAIRDAQQAYEISTYPLVLSFAGAQAHFEKCLINNGLARPENIITVQTCNRVGDHNGAEILGMLIKERDEHLPGMKIWPSSFESFVECYAEDEAKLPLFSKSSVPRWRYTPNYYREIVKFRKLEARPFDILDIDICGIFSEDNASTIRKLMQNQKLARKGLLFINHQKGRDGRFGALFEFLRRYYTNHPFFNPTDIPAPEEAKDIDLYAPSAYSFDVARQILVPAYYVCEAYEAGYHLDVELFEYRDRNEDTNLGVNMLQWVFPFERHYHTKEDRERLEYTLDIIRNESYRKHTPRID